ncbi:fimbrial protein [Pantoea ananatis]|uniref:fimbrial protein n=1 Tax=Pantoea ananas TaxID=553 RepID=UPI003FA4711A
MSNLKYQRNKVNVMKFLSNTALLALCMGISGLSYAETPISGPGGTIHFTGSITNSPCAVVLNNGYEQTVPLNQVSARAFSKAGDTGPKKTFDIILENCDVSTYKNATLSFNGQTDGNNKVLQLTNNGSNTAQGIGIQVTDVNNNPVSFDGTPTPATKLVSGKNTVSFTASYISTAATVTAGDANADMTFTLQYQ